MASGEGTMARGPVNEAVKEVSTRDWWVRWVVSESWAVLRLCGVSRKVSNDKQRRAVPCCAILDSDLAPQISELFCNALDDFI